MALHLYHDAIQKLFTICGAAGLSTNSSIQLAVRNIQANNIHGFFLYDSGAEFYNHVLLGADPSTVVI